MADSVIETAPVARQRPASAGLWGGLLFAGVILLTFIGPWLAPQSPLDFIGSPFQPPSAAAWLGTDVLGRDVLSRILAGGYRILGLSAIATVLGVFAGTLLGIAAGYFRGTADEATMRLLDVALAFPQIILALLFVSIIGPELWLITLIVAALHAPQVARVARAAALRVAGEDYIQYAEAIGTPRWQVMLREILPNITTPLVVELGLRFTYSIALIAGLSFLGLGVQPPTPDWGLMINENRIGVVTNPWPVIVPVIIIAVLTIGTNLFFEAVVRRHFGLEPQAARAAEPQPAEDAAR